MSAAEEAAARFRPNSLRATSAALLEWSGLTVEDATVAADVLVAADLRGVASHGVSNMLRVYVGWLRNGHVNPRPQIRVLSETPSGANIDSDRGLGVTEAPRAMHLAIEKAAATGVGFVTVGNGRHLGMGAYHAMMALPHDMIGLCLSATGPVMVPTFGREPRIGTNPIAFAAPSGKHFPVVCDFALTTVAGNKITTAQRFGLEIAAGLVADAEGRPIMQPFVPEARPDVTVPTGIGLLPLGSTPAMGSHKGYSLAVMVEVLTGILSGTGFGARAGRAIMNHMVAAVDIAAFVDLSRFKDLMDDFIAALQATPPAAGAERVLVPGQLEWEAEQDRLRHGIPLHPEVVAWFESACREAGLPCTLEAMTP